MVGVAGAELIVEDDRSLVGERRERFQVRARDTGAAVQHEERRSGAAADDPVPDASAPNLNVAFALNEPALPTGTDQQGQADASRESACHSSHGRLPFTFSSMRWNLGSCRTGSQRGLWSPHMCRALCEARSRSVTPSSFNPTAMWAAARLINKLGRCT